MSNLSNRASGPSNFRQEQQTRRAGMVHKAVGIAVPNFDAEAAASNVFRIKLTNSGATEKMIVLHPGMLRDISEIAAILGITADAIAKNGEVIASAVNCATKQNTSIEFLQKFANSNPTRIIRIQVEASTETQLSEDLVFAKINPFGKAGEITLNPAAVKKETNNQSKLVTLNPSNVQIDDQTVWFVNLLAGATLTLNLTMGVTSNRAAVLSEQAELAYGKSI